jgi:alpha-N-arabinofuranosidase
MALVKRMGWTPMLTVNLGTGSPEEARNWVEYCNAPAGTRVSDLRGNQSHGVKLWCLGNEMDGPWQLGHVPARDYAIRAQQAGKMMKDCDPSIELVACGSCGAGMQTYMEWDREVLEYLGDLSDYVSLHRYSANREGDTSNFLAEGLRVEKQILEMDAACRFVQARRRSPKRAYLCFDEWNVWYKNMQMDGAGKEAPRLIEEVYNLEDALVVAQYLNAFLRHADIVKIANLAQIVNVIAPLLAESKGVLKQSIFHAFAMVSNRRGGLSLTQRLEGPSYDVRDLKAVPRLDTSALLDGTKLKVFVVNRDEKTEQPLEILLAGRPIASFKGGEILAGSDPKAANSWESPDKVVPVPLKDVKIKDGSAVLSLPPLSFTALEFGLA